MNSLFNSSAFMNLLGMLMNQYGSNHLVHFSVDRLKFKSVDLNQLFLENPLIEVFRNTVNCLDVSNSLNRNQLSGLISIN